MKFKAVRPSIGDSFRVSDVMSLRFEKISEDLTPIWHEALAEPETRKFEDGDFVEVTEDCWFVLDGGSWRMMSRNEHIAAERQRWAEASRKEDL